MTERVRVGIVFGGRSGEHEVSLRSAFSVLNALDRDRYEPVLIAIDPQGHWRVQPTENSIKTNTTHELTIDNSLARVSVLPDGTGRSLTLAALSPVERTYTVDVVFPVLHGTFGEDGTVQGLFEMANVPYVGSGVLGSAAAMDKAIARRLLKSDGLPIVDGFVVHAREKLSTEDLSRRIDTELSWPVFIKPANMGSSVGVSKVTDRASLSTALSSASRYDTKLIIERAHSVREIEIAVLGNDSPEASLPGEIVPSHDFYSYEAKYIDSNGARVVLPASFSPERTDALRTLALRAFRALDLSGLARVDLFIDRTDDTVYINEVNTLPGFTDISMYPKLWAATGLSFTALIDRLIALALERHTARASLSTVYSPT